MMRLPLDEQTTAALGLSTWPGAGAAPGPQLLAAAHPCGTLLALARGPVLSVLPLLVAQQEAHAACAALQPQQQPALRSAKQPYTALAWFTHLKSSRAPRQAQPHAHHSWQGGWHAHQPPHELRPRPGAEAAAQGGSAQQQAPQQRQPGQPRCSLADAQELLEAEVLLSGTADGHLQIHAPDGQLLFRQRLAAGPVAAIAVRPHCSGLSSCDASEEVCVAFSNALVRINALELRAQVRMLQLAQAGTPSAAHIGPLPHVRYELPPAVGPRVAGLSFGALPADLYALLSSGAGGRGSSSSGQLGRHRICIVTAGRAPCLAAFEAEEHHSRSTLAALVGMASSLTSGVVGVASKAAGLGLAGPSLMYQSVRSIGRSLSSWYGAGSGHAPASAHAAVCFDDLAHAPKPEPLSLTRQLRDDDRVLEGLVPAPLGPLLAAPDNLGRVLLLEGAGMAAVRIWKGYRDAQCGWLLPPPGHPAAPLGLLLVLYAPKRRVLEVWVPRSGQRLASRAVEFPCLLIGVGLPCGGWANAATWGAWLSGCGSATTLVLDVSSGAAWDALQCLEDAPAQAQPGG